jgi:hypothetical protein
VEGDLHFSSNTITGNQDMQDEETEAAKAMLSEIERIMRPKLNQINDMNARGVTMGHPMAALALAEMTAYAERVIEICTEGNYTIEAVEEAANIMGKYEECRSAIHASLKQQQQQQQQQQQPSISTI